MKEVFIMTVDPLIGTLKDRPGLFFKGPFRRQIRAHLLGSCWRSSNFRVESNISTATLLCYLTNEYIMTLGQKDVNRFFGQNSFMVAVFYQPFTLDKQMTQRI